MILCVLEVICVLSTIICLSGIWEAQCRPCHHSHIPGVLCLGPAHLPHHTGTWEEHTFPFCMNGRKTQVATTFLHMYADNITQCFQVDIHVTPPPTCNLQCTCTCTCMWAIFLGLGPCGHGIIIQALIPTTPT